MNSIGLIKYKIHPSILNNTNTMENKMKSTMKSIILLIALMHTGITNATITTISFTLSGDETGSGTLTTDTVFNANSKYNSIGDLSAYGFAPLNILTFNETVTFHGQTEVITQSNLWDSGAFILTGSTSSTITGLGAFSHNTDGLQQARTGAFKVEFWNNTTYPSPDFSTYAVTTVTTEGATPPAPAAAPETSTIAMLASGILGFGASRRKALQA